MVEELRDDDCGARSLHLLLHVSQEGLRDLEAVVALVFGVTVHPPEADNGDFDGLSLFLALTFRNGAKLASHDADFRLV